MMPSDDGKEERPVLIKILVAILIGFLSVYDFFANLFTSKRDMRLEKSRRVKARPLVEGDPTSPWRNVDVEDNDLDLTMFPGKETLGEVWMEAVNRYADLDCMGTREVLAVHKEKQENGKVFEKLELGNYVFKSFTRVNKRVNLVASALETIGVKEKEHLVIFAETREEWMTTALAAFKSNIPIATVYATLGEEAVQYAINEVEAQTIVTSAPLLPKVYKAISNGVPIKNVIYFDSQDPNESGRKIDKHPDTRVLSFEELLNLGTPGDVPLRAKPEDLAVTMYTSGTTGDPKGVMLSHTNILAATTAQGRVVTVNAADSYIGYLPLAHILEICAELVCITKGTAIGYSSAQTLFDSAPKIRKGTKGDCTVLKPTFMACVPAVMDRIYKAVNANMNAKSVLFRELFSAAYQRQRVRYEDGYDTPAVLKNLVFKRISSLLGGEVKMILSGGAPLSAETQRFMNICFSCPVVQGYGLTETCAGGSIADKHDLTSGSVGAPICSNEIILREWSEGGYSPLNEIPRGEILIGGNNVAIGYYKNPKKTKEDFIFINGKRYFATGDIGELREDGSLKIIDRKKDLLKLAHGEYISLGKVESSMQLCPLVDAVCAYGDSERDYIVALIVPNQKNVTEMAEKADVTVDSWEKICDNNDVKMIVHKQITASINGKLERVEMPKKIHLCHEPWTPQSGLLTEALKLKRKAIENAFRTELESMYQ